MMSVWPLLLKWYYLLVLVDSLEVELDVEIEKTKMHVHLDTNVKVQHYDCHDFIPFGYSSY